MFHGGKAGLQPTEKKNQKGKRVMSMKRRKREKRYKTEGKGGG